VGVELVLPGEPGLFLGSLVAQPTFLDEIKQAETKDEEVKMIIESMNKRKALGFIEDERGVLKFQNQICVP